MHPFPEAIRSIALAHHDEWVKPLYAAHWPEALTGPPSRKLRFLSCNLYATAPYTVLFCASRAPRAVRTLRWAAAAFSWTPSSVSWFVQVMDDWNDLEKDADDIRPTPVLTGVWNLATLQESWEQTWDGVAALARESGGGESWVTFAQETYRMMAMEVMEAMGKGGAA